MPESIDPFAAFRLDDRVAIVTGASSGLGARFARVLRSAGARVILAARRVDRMEALAAEMCDEAGADVARAVACDIAETADNERLVADALAAWGRIDVLVNNAGITDATTPAEEESLEKFRRVIDVNLNGIFDLSRLVAPPMIEAGSGSIVNVSSVHGLVASAPNMQAGYAASKGAVTNLTRDLGCQWATKGVRVNAIAPGYFESELTQEMFDHERSLAWIQRNTPMRRPGRADEFDGALLYLASDASSYVTGSTIVVDGGWTAR